MINKIMTIIIRNYSNIEDVMPLNNMMMMKIKNIQCKMTNNVINNATWYLGNNMRHYKYKIKMH